MVANLSPEAVADLLKRDHGRLVLLDVREPDERAIARIEPSIHIPMNEVPSRHREIPSQRKVVVYCHEGFRSLVVASYLEGLGFSDVASLEGGIDAWAYRIDRTIPRY
jgi:rhodanese-related sulfurtransferase